MQTPLSIYIIFQQNLQYKIVIIRILQISVVILANSD